MALMMFVELQILADSLIAKKPGLLLKQENEFELQMRL